MPNNNEQILQQLQSLMSMIGNGNNLVGMGNNTSNTGQGLNIASGAVDALSATLPTANNDTTTNTINQVTGAASDLLASSPEPTTKAIGLALKASSFANKGLAKLTNGASTIKDPITGLDKVLTSDLFALTPLSAVNALGKKKIEGSDTWLTKGITKGYKPTEEVKGGEIGGVSNFFSKLFGKDKAGKLKDKVSSTNYENFLKAKVVKDSDTALQTSQSTQRDIYNKNINSLSGKNYKNTLLAAKGAKLTKIKDTVLNKKQNVIPDGALHSRVNSHDDEVTKKGIPVVSYEEGSTIQHAEIEKEELILTLEISKKLEELWSKSKKDDKDAVIEAGKLLTYEILENTEDNVGLLDKLE